VDVVLDGFASEGGVMITRVDLNLDIDEGPEFRLLRSPGRTFKAVKVCETLPVDQTPHKLGVELYLNLAT
jgi:hypothetical protein